MGQFYHRQDEDEADRKFIAERETTKTVQRGIQAQAQEVLRAALQEQQTTAAVILKILRKIHDPNRLTQFQKDLAAVAIGIEPLVWLQKEWS